MTECSLFGSPTGKCGFDGCSKGHGRGNDGQYYDKYDSGKEWVDTYLGKDDEDDGIYLFLPIGDRERLVIMDPGQNPKVERGEMVDFIGETIVGGLLGAAVDAAELALIVGEPFTPFPEFLTASIDTGIAAAGTWLSGLTYWNNTPHPELPPSITVGQDVLVTATDLAIGTLGGPIADTITTTASVFYDLAVGLGYIPNYISISAPREKEYFGQTWIIIWP